MARSPTCLATARERGRSGCLRTSLTQLLVQVEDAHRRALLDQRPNRCRPETARSARDEEGLCLSAQATRSVAIGHGVAGTRKLDAERLSTERTLPLISIASDDARERSARMRGSRASTEARVHEPMSARASSESGRA